VTGIQFWRKCSNVLSGGISGLEMPLRRGGWRVFVTAPR
jgi:hypothetical protein